MSKRFAIFPILFLLAFCNCDKPAIIQLFQFPDSITESSGLEISKNGQIWTHEDHGNQPELFALNDKGEIVKTLPIAGVANNDWEDISSDTDGNLYIGDFGNNDNERRNLGIYKIGAKDLDKAGAAVEQTTTFYYPDQSEFPPQKAGKYFDAEAFFVFKDNFYIFSKNRSKPFDGTTKMYRVPNQPGNHAAELIGSFQTCADDDRCRVTAADISPDGKRVALLGADQIWIFKSFKKDQFLSGEVTAVKLNHFSQKEGLCFKNNSTILISDERDKKLGGGYVYTLGLD